MVIVGVGAAGTMLAQVGRASLVVQDPRGSVLTTYLSMIIVNVALVSYVARIGRPAGVLLQLLGWTWRTVRRGATDAAIAFAAAFSIVAFERVFAYFRGQVHGAAVSALLPRSSTERALWVVVALSAGFCEEVVYRGYLQTQVWCFTRVAWMGVAVQAILFGIAHADQGLAGALRIAAYGVGLGILAWWRQSLVPGILCHAGIDLAAGLGA